MGSLGLLVVGARRNLAICCQELPLQVTSELQLRRTGVPGKEYKGRRGAHREREERGLKGVQSCMRDLDMVGGVPLECERVRGAR